VKRLFSHPDDRVQIFPLSTTSRFYVDRKTDSSINDVYPSPYANDPPWDSIKENLYIAKEDYCTDPGPTGNVVVISTLHKDDVRLEDYLKVIFGGKGSPIGFDDRISSRTTSTKTWEGSCSTSQQPAGKQ
jgi:acetone carboxylase gamma subunit